MNPRIANAVVLVLSCATVFAAPRHVPQASPTSAAGVIDGMTVDQTTGRPLGGVAVRLSLRSIERQTWIERTVTSDAGGRFTITHLPPGEWSFRTSLDGWTDAQRVRDYSDGYERVSWSPDEGLPLAAGQTIRNVRLGLLKFITLTGRVVDESGAPIAGATVSAMPYRAIAGRTTAVRGPDAKTDQNGVYRLSSLAAGDYVLSASVGFGRIKEIGGRAGADLFVLQRRFHPDVTGTAPPQPVSIEWGETPPPIGFTLHKGPAVRVTGRVTGVSRFRKRSWVHLEWTEPLAREDQLFAANAYLDARGNFSMAPVPPGRYVLTTSGAEAASGRLLWTGQSVIVGATDITDLKVPVMLGRRLSGRIEFDGSLPRPSADEMARIIVVLSEPDDLGGSHMMPPHATVRPDGTFTSAEMPGGRYVIRAWGQPEGWTLRSAMVGGKDAADTPITLSHDLSGAVLTFIDRAARISGQVVDVKGEPAARAHVLIFPASPALWTDFGPARRLRRVTTDTDGTYDLRSLPAGDYLIAAVSSIPRSGWRDEALLKILAASATRVTLSEGRDLSQPLRLVASPAR
jgi:hypothetical protein